MSDSYKTICVISRTKTTNIFISEELKTYFRDYVKIIQWPTELNTIPEDYIESDLFIFTSNKALRTVQSMLPHDKKILMAKRTINLRKIHELLEIEKGTKALLVQNSSKMAINSINIIHKLGINHIELIPYFPSTPEEITRSIKVAITTGLPDLIPEGIDNIIDLGTNILDVSTYADIVFSMSLPEELLDMISQNYINKIINITMSFLHASRENLKLKSQLEVILHSVNESIIAIDSNNKIVMINPMAEKTLNIESSQIVGKNSDLVFPRFEISKCLETGMNIVDDIKKIDNKHYVINKMLILDEKEHIIGVVATIRPASEVQQLETKIRKAIKAKGHVTRYTFDDILGDSPELQNSIQLAKKFSDSDLNILLVGDSGTGKELFAQSIHNSSERKEQPFVAINFAALPDNLGESELFGYEEGAFTGAKKGGNPGLFEEAHKGTIFLDEIGDTSLEVQKKILRIIEEKQVRRIGSSTITPIDVRIIAATHQDLNELVERKLFRPDLFFRLCTLPIAIPNLRNRANDLQTLIDYFSKRNYRRYLELESSLLDFIRSYKWPGNIRELENAVNYMCNTIPAGSVATIRHLPYYMTGAQTAVSTNPGKKLSSESGSNVIRELISKGDLETVFYILDEINKVSSLNKGIGRLRLKIRLEQNGISQNESKIKYLLKMLQDLGYISTGTTKQGSQITAKGEELLSMIHKVRS